MTDHEQPATGVALTREAIIAIIDANKYEAWTVDRAGQMADAILALRAPTEGMMSGLWGVGSWLSSALDDPKVCEEMKADIREWFDGGGHIRSKAPTDAGGAVSEADDQVSHLARTLDKSPGEIRRALANLKAKGLIALTPAPQAEEAEYRQALRDFNAMRDDGSLPPQPLQQGGEVTRAQVARMVDPETFDLIAHYAGIDRLDGLTPVEREPSVFKGYPDLKVKRDAALTKADAILALFASLAADRDKAVGLLRDILPQQGPKTQARINAFLSSQTEGR